MGNTNLATKFLKAMNLISQHNIETSSATVTIEGTVKEVVKDKAGEYIVALSDTANVTACANAVYVTGDRVLLLQPSTENQKHTILYKVNTNSDINIFRTQEDIWNRLGGNAIVGLVNKEFNGATGESVIINALQDGYATYIEKSHNLQLQVDFYANLLAATSSWENLNYGIKIKYKYRDLDSGEEGVKTEVFDINSMSGNPFWTADNYSREYITFSIDEKHEFLSIEQILFFWENLSELENIELKIKDLALYSVTPADVEKGYEALVYINGADRFAATSDNTATVELECRLKYQGLLQDTEDCIFVWAKENPAIDKNDGDFYDSRAGAGWEFLSESDAGDASYALPIARAAAPAQKIKCVVIKEDKILATSEPVIIKNLNTAFTFDFEIISTEPDSNAKVILTIAEKDGTELTEEVTYKWSRTLASGLYQEVAEGTTNAIEVDLSLLPGYAVYKCIVQSNTVYYGAFEITLNMRAKTDDKRVQILGGTTFLYNLGGERVSAPTDIENILEVVFFDNEGNIINYKDEEKEESNYTVQWKLPGWSDTNNSGSVDIEDTFNSDISLLFVTEDQKETVLTNKLSYSIASQYDILRAQKNSVEAIVTYQGVSYTNSIEIGFLRQGQPGTNGTQYICNILVNGSFKDWIYSSQYYQQPLFAHLTIQLKDIATNNIVSLEGINPIYEYKDGEKDEKGNIWKALEDSTILSSAAIIRAKVTVEGQTFYGYLTIVGKEGNLDWSPDTGFTRVLYSSSHTNPQYAANAFKFDKDVFVESSDYFTVSQKENQKEFLVQPIAQWEDTSDLIILEVTAQDNNGSLIIPLLYTYNRWEYAAINGWDGESVSTADGWVLAPTAGFGIKDSYNNFSGVVLGTREKAGFDSEQGIYGYCDGEETFRLDAADGSARFGRPGEGAIEIIPGEQKAIIQGGAYKEGESGMQIDLTTPEIKWGNGKFSVDANGIVNAVDMIAEGGTFTNITISKASNITDENGNPIIKDRKLSWAMLEKPYKPVIGDGTYNEAKASDGSKITNIQWDSDDQHTDADISTCNVWERLQEIRFGGSSTYTVRNLTGPAGEDGGSPTAQYQMFYFTETSNAPTNDDLWSKTAIDEETWHNIVEISSDNVEADKWYKNISGASIPNTKLYPWVRQATEFSTEDSVVYLLTAPSLAASDQRIVEWCKEGDTTLIDGGKIYAGSVSAGLIKTDSIRSFNYMANNGDYTGDDSITVEDDGTVIDYYADIIEIKKGKNYNQIQYSNFPSEYQTAEYFEVNENGTYTCIASFEYNGSLNLTPVNVFPVRGTYLDLLNGNFYAPNFRLGDINNIAGWQITEDGFSKSDGNVTTGMYIDGEERSSLWNFNIEKNAYMKSNICFRAGSIGGNEEEDNGFYVLEDGSTYARYINATEVQLGKIEINENAIVYDNGATGFILNEKDNISTGNCLITYKTSVENIIENTGTDSFGVTIECTTFSPINSSLAAEEIWPEVGDLIFGNPSEISFEWTFQIARASDDFQQWETYATYTKNIYAPAAYIKNGITETFTQFEIMEDLINALGPYVSRYDNYYGDIRCLISCQKKYVGNVAIGVQAYWSGNSYVPNIVEQSSFSSHITIEEQKEFTSLNTYQLNTNPVAQTVPSIRFNGLLVPNEDSPKQIGTSSLGLEKIYVQELVAPASKFIITVPGSPSGYFVIEPQGFSFNRGNPISPSLGGHAFRCYVTADNKAEVYINGTIV